MTPQVERLVLSPGADYTDTLMILASGLRQRLQKEPTVVQVPQPCKVFGRRLRLNLSLHIRHDYLPVLARALQTYEPGVLQLWVGEGSYVRGKMT